MFVKLQEGYQIDVDHIVSFTGDNQTGYAIDFDDKTSTDVSAQDMVEIMAMMVPLEGE